MNKPSRSKRLVRTQIMLTPELVRKIDAVRIRKQESRSAYLREAALLRLAGEERKKNDLAVLADAVIGSVSMEDHPVWKSEKSVEEWKKRMRDEWE